MYAATLTRPAESTQSPNTITTTLYDLFEAIQSEVGPEDDALVTATVMDLLASGRVKFVNTPEPMALACA